MNLYAIIFLGWLVLGLEVGLKDTLALGSTGVAPSFALVYAVYISLLASPRQALWSCFVIGLAMDLLSQVDLVGGGSATIIGPWALGTALGGQLVLAMRGIVIRQNPLTLALLAFLAALVANIVVVAFMSTRQLYADPIVFSTGDQLLRRLFASFYTALAAIPLALILLPIAPILGFVSHTSRVRTIR